MSQTHEFISAVVRNLPDDISPDVMQGWIGNPKALEKFLRGLCPLEVVALTLANFFSTRPGLWVSDDFRKRIVAKASDVSVVRKTTTYVLPRNMTDKEVEAELPENHHWTETDVCATVAHMINLQPNGKKGVLLNDGHANLFYTSSDVVLVYWDADNRGWDVHTWERDDRRWDAGDRVFSPATGA